MTTSNQLSASFSSVMALYAKPVLNEVDDQIVRGDVAKILVNVAGYGRLKPYIVITNGEGGAWSYQLMDRNRGLSKKYELKPLIHNVLVTHGFISLDSKIRHKLQAFNRDSSINCIVKVLITQANAYDTEMHS